MLPASHHEGLLRSACNWSGIPDILLPRLQVVSTIILRLQQHDIRRACLRMTNQWGQHFTLVLLQPREAVFGAYAKGSSHSFPPGYHLNKLVYFEFHERVEWAITREKQIKAGSRKKKADLINTKNPAWLDLYQTEVKYWRQIASEAKQSPHHQTSTFTVEPWQSDPTLTITASSLRSLYGDRLARDDGLYPEDNGS